MLRIVNTQITNNLRRRVVGKNSQLRCKSSSAADAKQAGDEGVMGTKIYHHGNTVLALMFPLAIYGVDADSDVGKGLGVLTAGYVGVHSYIGMNYVVTDYIPKFFGKGAVGPSRAVTTALGFITFFGMSKISLYSPGGLPAVVKGLWNGKKAEKKE